MIEMNLLRDRAKVVGYPLRFSAVQILVAAVSLMSLTACLVVVLLGGRTSPVAPISLAVDTVYVEKAVDAGIPSRVSVPSGSADYPKTSVWERLSYEIPFSTQLLQNFTALVPDGIDFTLIHVKEYKTLVAEGSVRNKEVIAKLLLSLRESNNWSLKAKPQTVITASGDQYRFRIQADFRSLPDERISEVKMPEIDDLDSIKVEILKNVSLYGLTVPAQGLMLLDSQVDMQEKVYQYCLKGGGDFAAILHFVRSLSTMNLPISCRELQIRAVGNSIEYDVKIDINAK